jgi:hypothetical protein
MSASEAELVKNGKLTTFYMRLLHNVNNKLDNKIDVASKSLLADFEQKKADLLKSKKRLEDLHKMRVSIQDINKFYKYPNRAEPKKEVKSIKFDNKPSNPNTTTRNILDTLENIEVKIDNGEYVQLVQKATSTTNASPSLLVQDSDKPINSYTRFSIKKRSNVVKIDDKQSGFETAQMNIVVHFKGYRVNPEFVNIRYLTLPNEPKQLFSYINTVLGSNDGVKWEPVGNINPSMMRNFEKATLFKYPVPLKTQQFYEYLCFQSQGTKEAIPKEHVSKLSSRTTIPICNFELFGNYYSNSVNIANNKVEEDFQKFFDEYVNTTYSSTSNKTELEYLVKMTLEAYKELSDVITECKLKNANVIKETSVITSNNSNTSNNSITTSRIEDDYINMDAVDSSEVLELTYDTPFKISEESSVPEYSEEPQEGQSVDSSFVANEPKEDDLDADLMALMNNTKKANNTKQMKILDTETNSITLGNNRDKHKKKKANK